MHHAHSSTCKQDKSYKQELSQSARFGSAPEWVVGLNIRSGRLLHLSECLITYHLVQQYPSSPWVGIQVPMSELDNASAPFVRDSEG